MISNISLKDKKDLVVKYIELSLSEQASNDFLYDVLLDDVQNLMETVNIVYDGDEVADALYELRTYLVDTDIRIKDKNYDLYRKDKLITEYNELKKVL